MDGTISERAAAARESARDPHGRFGAQPAQEVDFEGDLRTGPSGDEAAAIEKAQLLTMDSTTGASAPLRRVYTWVDKESGDFQSWSEDLANDPPDSLSEDARADWRTINEGLAAGDDAQTISDALIGKNDEKFVASLDTMVQAHRDVQAGRRSTPEAEEMAWERRSHEADGNFIDVDHYTGEVAWRTPGSGGLDPLYRHVPEEGGRPAFFDADGTPRVWVRGTTRVASVWTDGSKTFTYPDGTDRVHVRGNGEFFHYDEEGEEHRESGPAVVTSEAMYFKRHGVMHRDPKEGPAGVLWTGEVIYGQDGRRLDPTPEAMARHGVEAYGQREADAWSAVLDNRGDTDIRYRFVGTDPDTAVEQGGEGERTFDLSASPTVTSQMLTPDLPDHPLNQVHPQTPSVASR